MENVVPGALQRLRAADIVRIAGLTAASLGQEYCRSGVIQKTQRQGARLSGIVELRSKHALVTPGAETAETVTPTHYPVEVEIQSSTAWVSSCICDTPAQLLCVHAAALLYQWLAHPESFVLSTLSSPRPAPPQKEPQEVHGGEKMETHLATAGKLALVQRGPAPLSRMVDILGVLGLNELRGIAREYEISANGMGKPQLLDAILAAMRQPEAVRHVAASLEKTQRQLLAALTLAGGSMTDEDLRGLFERFSLGQPGQFQSVIATLQSKALLFRAALNSSLPQRIGLGGSPLDLVWYVPAEVRAALRVTVPVTPFDLQQSNEGKISIDRIEPYSLLDDLLLVARALDGYQLAPGDEWSERSGVHSTETAPSHRTAPTSSKDGSAPLPSPSDMPSVELLSALQKQVSRAPVFLRFAIQLLKLADILHKDDHGIACLRVLPNAPQLLLGAARSDVLRDLFELWLTQSSYAELFALQEDGVRLRCRATLLNVPVMRGGELDAENNEARQALIALLTLVSPNQWVSFPAFARFVYRLNPLFLQKRQRLFPAPHWWMEREEGRPLRPTQLNDWWQGEYYYLARLLSGPLHWWGVCDVASTPDGRLAAFYLTPLASMLLGRQPSGEYEEKSGQQETTAAIEVMDTEEVVVACSSAAWPIIELLETFAEGAGVHDGRLCYRFTPGALSRALSRGHHPTRLLEQLRLLPVAQPANSLSQIIARLECWLAGYGRARLYQGVALLEVADTLVMRELSATTSLDKHVVQTIQPTLLVLRKPGAEMIIDDLKRRGQTPLLHDEDTYGAE